MRLSDYLYFLRKRTLSQRMTLYCILVTTIGFSLLIISVVLPQVLRSGRKSIKRCLSDDLNRYAVAMVDGDTFRYAEANLLDEIISSPEIESFGTWNSMSTNIKSAIYDGVDYAGKMLDIHNANVKAFPTISDGHIQGINMPYSVYRFNNIEVITGDPVQIDSDKKVAYLGYNYRDAIPLGTVIELNEVFKYEVAGVLSEGQKIVDADSLLMNRGGLGFDYTTTLDNMVLFLSPQVGNRAVYSVANYVSFSDGVSYEQGKKALEKIFYSNGYQIQVNTLENRIDEVMSVTDWILKRFKAATFIFVVLSVLSIVLIQMLTFFTRKDEIGIWYSCGMGSEDVMKLLIFENLFKTFVSCLLAFLVYFLFLKINGITTSTMYNLRSILFFYGPVAVFLAGILIAAITSAASVAYIRNKTIRDMINGNW